MEEKQPKEFRIMFKPTGIVYTLPEAEIQRILKDDHGFNYEVLDKGIHIETPETVQITTTFQQVVEGNEVQDGPQPDNAPAEVQENVPLEPPTESGEYTTPEGLTITVENQVTEENSETEGDNA